MIRDVRDGNLSSFGLYTEIYKLGDEYYYNYGNTLYKATLNNVDSIFEAGFLPYIKPMNNMIYFIAYTGVWTDSDGRLLWKTDGTRLGTKIVKDMVENTFYDQVSTDLYSHNNLLFYAAVEYEDEVDWVERSYLWSSDGTEVGTKRIQEITYWEGREDEDESAGQLYGQMVGMGEYIFFQGTDQAVRDSLWISDGTAVGTRMLKVIRADGFARISGLTAVNNFIYFVANAEDYSKTDLWKSDGTVDGTIRIRPGYNIPPSYFTACNSTPYFLRNKYLYIVTTTDTIRPIDIVNDIVGGDISALSCLDDVLYVKTRNNDGKYLLYSVNPKQNNAIEIVNDSLNDSLNIRPYLLEGRLVYDVDGTKHFEDYMIYSTDDEVDYKLWKYSLRDGNSLITSKVK